MVNRLDDSSISCVLEFLPVHIAQTCRLISRRWSIAAAMFHRRMMDLFDRLHTGPVEHGDCVKFCDQVLDHKIPAHFLGWVPSGWFKIPFRARARFIGAGGNRVEIICELSRDPRDPKFDAMASEIAGGVASGGHVDIIRDRWELFSKEDCIKNIMRSAAHHGHINIIRLCFDICVAFPVFTELYYEFEDDGTMAAWLGPDYSRFGLPHPRDTLRPQDLAKFAAGAAAARGHLDITRLCLERAAPAVATDRVAFVAFVTRLMRTAVRIDAPRLVECVRLCHGYGGLIDSHKVDIYDNACESITSLAAHTGNIDVVRLCLELGSAHAGGHSDIIRLCHAYGGAINSTVQRDGRGDQGENEHQYRDGHDDNTVQRTTR